MTVIFIIFIDETNNIIKFLHNRQRRLQFAAPPEGRGRSGSKNESFFFNRSSKSRQNPTESVQVIAFCVARKKKVQINILVVQGTKNTNQNGHAPRGARQIAVGAADYVEI